MKKWFSLLVILGFLVLPGSGMAQEEKDSVTALDEVVVTASRVAEKKKEITVNVTIIDEQEIQMSTARDLGELLAQKGIGHIQRYPGTLTAVGVRGFRTETHGNDLMGHILVLLNGRRAGTGNLAKIMTKNVERIEIIRGPASAQYGSAAMGGVINVITRQGKGKPGFFVEGTLGSWGYEEGSIGASGKVKQFDFSGSYTSAAMDDYETADEDKYYNTGYDDEDSISLNLGFEFLPGHRIGIIYTSFDVDHAGTPNYLSLNDLDDYKEAGNESFDLVYDGGTQDGRFLWSVRYFSTEDKTKGYDPVASNPDFWDDGDPYHNNTDQQGAQGQVTANLGNYRITAGIDWVEYDIDATWDPEEYSFDNPAYYLLGKAKFFDQRLIFSAGLRYDEYEVEVIEPEGNTESDENFSTRLGVAYLLTDYLKVRANYGEAFKMPDAKELAGDYGAWTRHVGNPDLDPETSQTYEGGVDVSYGAFNSALTYFYSEFKDKIQTVALDTGDNSWENLGDATVSGFEADFSYDFGSLFGWELEVKPYVNFVYLTEYEDEDEEEGEDLKYTPEHTASYGISISDFDGFSTRLNFTYTGEKYIDDYESGWPAEVIEVDDFTVADFMISKRIMKTDRFGNLTLRGEIKNLFNKDYEYAKGYPMPGRSFYIGMRYDY